jgi:DNA-binding response OmpR family regulator
MTRILLIEDDPSLSRSIPVFLGNEGYSLEVTGTLAGARKHLSASWDLIILDWMLPDGQGIDFLREARAEGHGVPVIFLTARSDLVDKVLGLESGANDYLTKPFEPRELVARVRVQLRAGTRPQTPQATVLKAGPVEIDAAARTVRHHGRSVELTKMEYDLLKLLCENPNRVFSRDELLNQVWGFDQYPTTRTVDTHILQLRQKLSDSLFETIRGVGYRLKI